jgi:hypothetical protein
MFTPRTSISANARVFATLIAVGAAAACATMGGASRRTPRRRVVYCDSNGTAWSSSHHFA